MIDILTWLILPYTLISFLVSILFIFIGIFMIMRTPVLTFFRASIRGKTIAMVYRRDRRLHFIETDLRGDSINDREYGVYYIPEDSVYSETKSGASMVLLSSDVGLGISPELAQAINKLHEMGIPSIKYAEYIHECKDCEHVGIVNFGEKIDPKTAEKIKTISCSKCDGQNLESVDIKIDLDKTRSITIGRIKDYLKKINPTFLRGITVRDLDDERQDLKDFLGGNLKLVGLGLTVILIVVGVIIFLTFMNSQPDPISIATQCKQMWNTLTIQQTAAGV
jgi:hypothetical protein